ncbi:MAG: hypothetical protein QE486_04895 [Burkholderiaceae bacterium]|nr:hypothetical protein [Burkholderiaceae bacterium]
MKFKLRSSFNKLVLSGLLSLASFATLPLLAQASQDAPRAGLTVTVTRPEIAQIAAVITANGSVAAWQEALIGAQVGGLRMAEVLVNVGDVVQKGQLLALFATDTVLADLAVQKAQQAEATAALADAKANAARARSLKNSGALSAQQINQYLTAEQTAQARLEATAALVQVQALRLKYAEVRAPDDGVISMRQATVGSVVPQVPSCFGWCVSNALNGALR